MALIVFADPRLQIVERLEAQASRLHAALDRRPRVNCPPRRRRQLGHPPTSVTPLQITLFPTTKPNPQIHVGNSSTLEGCRYALSVTAHRRVTEPIVVDEFKKTYARHGIPYSTLTDNGMAFTTRFAGGKGGRNRYEAELHHLGVRQINSPPTTYAVCPLCGSTATIFALSAVDLVPERYARPMARGTPRAGRWAVIRDALSNANIAKAETSIAVGTVAHVAWNSTMLVITFDAARPDRSRFVRPCYGSSPWRWALRCMPRWRAGSGASASWLVP